MSLDNDTILKNLYLWRFNSFKETLIQMKKAILLLVLLTGFLLFGTAQNINLIVTTNDGTEQTFQMTDESQLYFNGDDRLVIEEGMGSVVTFQLSEIRKIVCSEFTGVNENDETALQISPNPSQHYFVLNNLQDSQQGRIYTLDGRMVKEFEATEGSVVDISDFPQGMYLLHINGQTLKLMKL